MTADGDQGRNNREKIFPFRHGELAAIRVWPKRTQRYQGGRLDPVSWDVHTFLISASLYVYYNVILAFSSLSAMAIGRHPPFLRLPPEVFNEVVFELAASQPLGPPYAVHPLFLTCHATYDLISTRFNTLLWSRVFRYKFDSSAVTRRAFAPTPQQCVDQLIQYCEAMQVIRRANSYTAPMFEGGVEVFDDLELEDALTIALVMMMEDDGRNMKQLEEWAGLRPLLWHNIRHRLYEGSKDNRGWAFENRINITTMWLMWMMSTEG